jgi:hypothetical protein
MRYIAFIFTVYAVFILAACDQADESPSSSEEIVSFDFSNVGDSGEDVNSDLHMDRSVEDSPAVSDMDSGSGEDQLGQEDVEPCSEDNDEDGDGVCDEDDICPFGSDHVDGDGDGIPDRCDCDVVEMLCDEMAVCVEEPGSAHCECLPGYVGNGMTCEEDDPCLDDPCAVGATCSNTTSGFQCYCPEDYSSPDPYVIPCLERNASSCVEEGEFWTECCNFCGDIDNNGLLNILDTVQLINLLYDLYSGGDYDMNDVTVCRGNVNGDMTLNVMDLAMLINSTLHDVAPTCIAGGGDGCTDPVAINYDPEALLDDGSCINGTHVNLIAETSPPEFCPDESCPIVLLVETTGPIASFQVQVEGGEVLNHSGGAADEIGFMMDYIGDAAWSYHLTGFELPAGEYVLSVLEVRPDSEITMEEYLDNFCLKNVLFSGPGSALLSVDYETCDD